MKEKKYKLGEVIELHYGRALTASNRIPGDIPVYSSAGITGSHNIPLCSSPSIIIGRKGTVGSVFYNDRPFFCIDTAYYILPKDDIYDLKFLYYLLQTLGLDKLNEDSAVPGLNRGTAYKQEISLPPLPTQSRIASILSAFDNKIENNRRMNQTLEEMAQALFNHYFVDNVDPDNLPEGWRWGKLGELSDVKGGGTPSTKHPEFWNGNIHWTSPKDLSSLSFPVLLDTEKKITEAGLKKVSSGLLPKGTLLLSSRAPIGYLAITEIPTAINQGYIALQCNKNFSNLFLLYWLKKNIDLIISNANGSTFLEISKTAFRNIEIIIPDNKFVSKFTTTIEPLFSQIVKNEKENLTLKTVRDLLLPKLMSGEIDVSSIDEKELQSEELLSNTNSKTQNHILQ